MKGLDFDDILLIPRGSTINSRDSADISVVLGKDLKLNIPIIASPMKGIVSVELIKEMSKLGGIGILHKFYEDTRVWEQDIISLQGINFGASVGLNEGKKSQIAINSGAKILCIDVANGYLESVLNFTSRTADYISNGGFNTLLMVGNVVTVDGANNLRMAGADMIRVGIGSGNLCTTRNVTGVGMPQLTALSLTSSVNVRDHYYGEYDTIIVADGGIRNSGDAVKAFVFGADVVMLGSLLATTYESANNGIIYGMASRRMQDEYYHGVKSVEGIEQSVTPVRPLAELIDEFTYGIKSACTYLNAPNLRRLRSANYVEISHNAIKKL